MLVTIASVPILCVMLQFKYNHQMSISSQDVPLDQSYVRRRMLTWIPAYIVFSMAPLLLPVMASAQSSLSFSSATVITLSIFLAWSIIFFYIIRAVYSTQYKNFYFECGDDMLEFKRGMLATKSTTYPYSQVKGATLAKSSTGSGGKLGGGAGFGVGMFEVVITLKEGHPWQFSFGGFTKEGAQKIVDFIQAKIVA